MNRVGVNFARPATCDELPFSYGPIWLHTVLRRDVGRRWRDHTDGRPFLGFLAKSGAPHPTNDLQRLTLEIAIISAANPRGLVSARNPDLPLARLCRLVSTMVDINQGDRIQLASGNDDVEKVELPRIPCSR